MSPVYVAPLSYESFHLGQRHAAVRVPPCQFLPSQISRWATRYLQLKKVKSRKARYEFGAGPCEPATRDKNGQRDEYRQSVLTEPTSRRFSDAGWRYDRSTFGAWTRVSTVITARAVSLRLILPFQSGRGHSVKAHWLQGGLSPTHLIIYAIGRARVDWPARFGL